MKSYKLVVGLFLLLFLGIGLSCTKSDDDAASERATLVGTWDLTMTSTNQTVNDVPYKNYLADSLNLLLDNIDNNYDRMISNVTKSGSIEIRDDGTYTMNYSGENAYDGTWVLADDKKTIKNSEKGHDYEIEIQSHSAEEVILRIPVRENDNDWNGDGHNEDFLIDVTMTLKK